MTLPLRIISILGFCCLAVIAYVSASTSTFILVGLMASILLILSLIANSEHRERVRVKHALEDLERAYEELDEQAKLIVRTDLKLNRAQEEIDRRLEGLTTLHDLAGHLGRTNNYKELLGQLDHDMVYRLGFDRGYIALWDASPAELSYTSGAGYLDDERSEVKEKLQCNQRLSTVSSGAQVRALSEDGEFLKLVFGVDSGFIAPILVGDNPTGLLMLGSNGSDDTNSVGDSELVSILADQFGVAVENAQLYDQLWNSSQDLEFKVQERTRELEKANTELQSLDARKKQFVSAVSHELRTPLTSIKGFASILAAGKLGKLTMDQKARLEKINKHSDSLVQLVNNLLDISRIESGKVEMDMRQVSLPELIDTAVDLMMPLAKDKQVDLRVEWIDHIPMIEVDKNQFERVFINLISNAVKFTPADGHITIRIARHGTHIRFEVEDTGAGIPEKDQPRLFDEFYRVQNDINQEVKGTGLGLSLVKHIVEAHQGKIWLNSVEGRGTTFSFEIPELVSADGQKKEEETKYSSH